MTSHYSPALGPWSTDGRVLRDANGNSIASGGNNRVIVGPELASSLKLAAAAPAMAEALQKALLHMLTGHKLANTDPEAAWKHIHKAEDICRAAIAAATR